MKWKILELYHSMLKGHAKYSSLDCAFAFYLAIRRAGFRPIVYNFTYLLKVCSDWSDLRTGREIHAQLFSNGFSSNVFVMTVVINMYVKCRWINYARRMFDRIPERDMMAWNVIVVGPDSITLSFLIPHRGGSNESFSCNFSVIDDNRDRQGEVKYVADRCHRGKFSPLKTPARQSSSALDSASELHHQRARECTSHAQRRQAKRTGKLPTFLVGLAVYKQLHGSRLNCHATCPKPPATSSLPWRHVKASLHPCAVHGSASWAWAEVGPFCCILPYAALHAPAACHDSRFLRAMLGQMLRFRASASSHLFATAKSTSRSTCAWTVPAHCLMSTRCLACLAHMPTLLDPRSNEPILAPSHAVESKGLTNHPHQKKSTPSSIASVSMLGSAFRIATKISSTSSLNCIRTTGGALLAQLLDGSMSSA
ncbi:hypothetical protein ZIOFF_019667 [Zingiber officinale]|uniref:Pentatricopeptide repeat-containing protein n=1 Tax=Zingiber officinale TaxID=94328 RepID=A0A8J5HS73_ZINOF|nr:hypothetical protein ZIOFF_019667 [Zingiber officinale]